jgi:hypothetical protein
MARKRLCVLLLIVLTQVFSGCIGHRPPALLTDFPDYFDLPAGSELTTTRDYGRGPEPVQIKTKLEMGCYSKTAQADALAIKKGNV